MFNKQKILGIVPARSGSKGVPKKNIRLLYGKPLISYTIEAAKQSKYIDRVIISTDSEEIADVACAYGAEKLFLRPQQYSTDESPSYETIIHAIEWLDRNKKMKYPIFCLLQPTSPFRTSNHIDQAIEKFFSISDADALVSVCESSKSPFWSQIISDKEFIKPLISTSTQYSRRQELPRTFDLNGAIYIARTEKYLISKSFSGEKTTYYQMNKDVSLDIDSEFDFTIAEVKLKQVHE